uniref:Uncharacterized protein n=1 Tax=Cannabis sativa TaxID=3483 RepID=A0A803P3B7_CANSA
MNSSVRGALGIRANRRDVVDPPCGRLTGGDRLMLHSKMAMETVLGLIMGPMLQSDEERQIAGVMEEASAAVCPSLEKSGAVEETRVLSLLVC